MRAKTMKEKELGRVLNQLGFPPVTKLDWTGTVKAVTQVRDDQSKTMTVKVTVGNIFLEVDGITDEVQFKQLSRIVELDRHVKVTIEEVTKQ